MEAKPSARHFFVLNIFSDIVYVFKFLLITRLSLLQSLIFWFIYKFKVVLKTLIQILSECITEKFRIEQISISCLVYLKSFFKYGYFQKLKTLMEELERIRKNNFRAILDIMFWDFTLFKYRFDSLQVKGQWISSIKKIVFELPQVLPSNLWLRILTN